MNRAMLTALVVASASTSSYAQDTAVPAAATTSPADAPAEEPAAAEEAATPAMSQEQIVAFNKAVADFGAAQTAQQGGDNATASTKYAAALPAIRDAVKAQPDNMDNVNFLANALYANAAAEFALGKNDPGFALMEESLPYWKQLAKAKPADANIKTVLTNISTQIGNLKLSKQDKAGATPYYADAVANARQLVAASPSAANKNLLLAALVGSSQIDVNNKAVMDEAISMSKAMIADGSVDASNKPAAQVLSGAATAAPAPAAK